MTDRNHHMIRRRVSAIGKSPSNGGAFKVSHKTGLKCFNKLQNHTLSQTIGLKIPAEKNYAPFRNITIKRDDIIGSVITKTKPKHRKKCL